MLSNGINKRILVKINQIISIGNNFYYFITQGKTNTLVQFTSAFIEVLKKILTLISNEIKLGIYRPLGET